MFKIIGKIKSCLSNKDSLIYKSFLAPVIKVEDSKNYRLFGKYLYINSSNIKKTFEYAIYIDNEDVSSLLQLEKWFINSFFDKNNTIIIVRKYSKNILEIIEYLEQNGYSFYIYTVLKNIDISSFKIKFIFYLFNSYTNPVLVKNRAFKHIWIGHGESDKLASVNPMIKIYDYIFVAGDIAIKRLQIYNIINRCDIYNGKVIKIGMPYLKKEEMKKKSINDICDIKNILYAPTWEGVENEQEYSSLKNNFGLKILKQLIQINNNLKISFKPHPSTGIKKPEYISYVNAIKEEFSGITIYLDKYSFLYSKLKDKTMIVNDFNGYTNYDLIITDNSSIISLLVYHKLNYIVLVNKNSYDVETLPLLSISTLINDNVKDIDITHSIKKELISDKMKRFSQVVAQCNKKVQEIISKKGIDANL